MVRPISHARYDPGSRGGFIESYVLRAHHPEAPYAFWFRYALKKPPAITESSMGELTGVFFDGVRQIHTVAVKSVPADGISFASEGFHVRLGEAELCASWAVGEVSLSNRSISWKLEFEGREDPIFLLPRSWYEKAFPREKSLVIVPQALFNGMIKVNGEDFPVCRWRGSVNHNWGKKYSDEYAWGQIAGFDTHPESFLEVATACLRWGPLKSPNVTPLVLRHRGEEFAFNTFFNLCDSRGSFSEYVWVFRAEKRGVRIEGTISAQKDSFVGLTYRNPSGEVKYCLNTQLAASEVKFEDLRRGMRRRETLFTRHRASFEIVTGRNIHSTGISRP